MLLAGKSFQDVCSCRHPQGSLWSGGGMRFQPGPRTPPMPWLKVPVSPLQGLWPVAVGRACSRCWRSLIK